MNNDSDDLLGMLDTSIDVSPVKSLPPENARWHRREERYMAAWKISVAAEGQGLHDGKLRDISLHGAAILVEHNLTPHTRVMLHVHVPSLEGRASKILVVHGVTTYTVHDMRSLRFRTGISFAKFEVASDQAYLESRLANHHSKVL